MATPNPVELFKDKHSKWLDGILKSAEGREMMMVLYSMRPDTSITDNGFANSGKLGALDGFDKAINMLIFMGKPNEPTPQQPVPDYPEQPIE